METKILADLNTCIPIPLQDKYTIIPDKHNKNRYVLAEINKDFDIVDFHAHTPTSNTMTEKELAFFLLGMQKACIIHNN